MSDYYSLLNITESATIDEIKQAYRKAALKYHPDINNNTPESIIQFIVIKNAYDVLVCNEKKINYDVYQDKHHKDYRTGKNTEVSTVINAKDNSSIVFENILNSIFWDIEDLLKESKNLTNRVYTYKILKSDLLRLLFFIEKWVLVPVGLKDYFMESRQLDEMNLEAYIDRIVNNNKQYSHFPYSTIESYFYNLRIRLNTFIKNFYKYDLFKTINNSDIRLIDSLMNVQNYSMYVINEINIEIREDKISESKYEHPNTEYYK